VACDRNLNNGAWLRGLPPPAGCLARGALRGRALFLREGERPTAIALRLFPGALPTPSSEAAGSVGPWPARLAAPRTARRGAVRCGAPPGVGHADTRCSLQRASLIHYNAGVFLFATGITKQPPEEHPEMERRGLLLRMSTWRGRAPRARFSCARAHQRRWARLQDQAPDFHSQPYGVFCVIPKNCVTIK